MRLALHIFRKDVRRFWWEILVTGGALAYLAMVDAQRFDFIPGPMEGLLHLVVPAAWAYLIAMAIHEEALVGDRQFWTTRPYPRGSLLLAKAMFVLACVHAPALLAHAYILAIHEFNPLRFAPQLAWMQLVICFVVTLPAATLASVTRNLSQFVGCVFALLGSAYLLLGSFHPGSPWVAADPVRSGLLLLVLSAFAVAAIALQYSGARTQVARASIAAGVLAIGSLYAYLPRDLGERLRCRGSAEGLSLQRGTPPTRTPINVRREQPAIPMKLEGMPDGKQMRLVSRDVELLMPNAERIGVSAPRIGRPVNADEFYGYMYNNGREAYLTLIIGRTLLPRALAQPIDVAGTAYATTYRDVPGAAMEAQAGPTHIPGIGRCSSGVVPNWSGVEDLLRTFCESPVRLPLPTRVTLKSGSAEWRHRLGDSTPGLDYFWNDWLSPLHRRQTFFHLVSDRPPGQGSQWIVPSEALKDAHIEFGTEQWLGCGVVSYRLPQVALRDVSSR